MELVSKCVNLKNHNVSRHTMVMLSGLGKHCIGLCCLFALNVYAALSSLIIMICNVMIFKTQFQGWRNKSSAMKAQTGELEETTDAVVLDIKQLGESVRIKVIHSLHAHLALKSRWKTLEVRANVFSVHQCSSCSHVAILYTDYEQILCL